MHLDLTDLRLFLHVVEAGSITHGATRAHLALASASARLSGLEAALGSPLLTRGRRGVTPTAAGRALAHHARAVLDQVAQLEGALGQYGGGLRGQVRLLGNTAAVAEHLPEPLAAFLAARPAIDVTVEERPSYRIVEDVAAGRAELGLLADTGDLGALESRPFRTDRLVAILPRGHALARRRRLAFAELLDAPLVGLAEGSALQDHLAGHAARLGRTPHYRVRLGGTDAVCRLVAAGVGPAVVPEAAARRASDAAALRCLPLTDPWAIRPIRLVCRSRDALPPPARLLHDALAAAGPP